MPPVSRSPAAPATPGLRRCTRRGYNFSLTVGTPRRRCRRHNGCAVLASSRADSADGNAGGATASHGPHTGSRQPLAEVKNKAEAGSVATWWADLWARRRTDLARRWPSVFAVPEAPKAGEAPSVRWSLFESDPSLNQSLISEGTTISQLFDQDKWERHRRVDRYWRHSTPMSLLTSTVFRRVAKPILSLTCLAALICGYNLLLVPALATAVPRLGVSWLVAPSVVSLNITPFSLVSPMIGLLLVFRTNFSYARFLEGRLLWGSAVRHCRDAARLVATYLPPSVARTALFGHLQAWTWLLKAHLRAGRSRTDPNDPTAYKDDPSRDVRACLPPEQSEPLLGATNRPYVSVLTLTALLRHLRGGLPDYATRRLEEIFVEMGAVTGGCERLLSTPMPLSYTRFTGRSLMVWLGTLPLALWPLMGWATVPAMFVLSYVVLGIDEIGVEIEEPFAILPLQALCEAVRRDVGIAEAQSAVLLQAWPGGLGYDKEPTSASLVSALAAMQDGVDYGRPPPPLK